MTTDLSTIGAALAGRKTASLKILVANTSIAPIMGLSVTTTNPPRRSNLDLKNMNTKVHDSKDLFDCVTASEAAEWLNGTNLTLTQRRGFFASWLVGRKKSAEEIAADREAFESGVRAQNAHEEARRIVAQWASLTGRTGGKWKNSRKAKIKLVQRDLLNGTFKPETLLENARA